MLLETTWDERDGVPSACRTLSSEEAKLCSTSSYCMGHLLAHPLGGGTQGFEHCVTQGKGRVVLYAGGQRGVGWGSAQAAQMVRRTRRRARAVPEQAASDTHTQGKDDQQVEAPADGCEKTEEEEEAV